MRKIDGLKIDFSTGTGSIALPAEFAGQSPQFQAVVCGYWIAGLHDVREKVMERVGADHRRSISRNFDGKTIDQLLSEGHGVMRVTAPHPGSHKRLLITTNVFNTSPKVSYCIWESIGYSSFVRIAEVPCRSRSVRGIRRGLLGIEMRWTQLQELSHETSAARTGSEAGKPYRHFTADIGTYLLGDDNRD
ncbi:MAG: hypothetical protein ABL934_03110 [Lysobacteraceae bacterium]